MELSPRKHSNDILSQRVQKTSQLSLEEPFLQVQCCVLPEDDEASQENHCRKASREAALAETYIYMK